MTGQLPAARSSMPPGAESLQVPRRNADTVCLNIGTLFPHGSTPWVSAKDMKTGSDLGFIGPRHKRGNRYRRDKNNPNNSILFVVRGMILPHTFPVAITERQLTINHELKALVPAKAEQSKYLFLVLKCLGPDVLFPQKKPHLTLEESKRPYS